MKSKKGIDIVTSVGTRLYDAFVNASTSGMKRVVTTVGTGDGPNQMAMQNDTTIVDAISASGGGGLPTEKAVADAMCKTVWTGNLALRAALSNTRFSATMPVLLSKKYYIVLHFTGSLASSSSSSTSSSIDFAAILKPSVMSDNDDTKTTASVAQRMSANIALNANIVITFTSNNVSVFVSAVGDLPYVKSLSLRRVDILTKII
jgi:hypothetical protein